jgi:hypothetical protein
VLRFVLFGSWFWRGLINSFFIFFLFKSAFLAERKEILEKFRKEWEDKMEERRNKEILFLEARFKRVEENEKQLHILRVKDSEEYNEMKVKLETDVQVRVKDGQFFVNCVFCFCFA